MKTRQVFNDIPYSKLRPASQCGHRASFSFAAAVGIVLLGHSVFPGWSAIQQAMIASFCAALVFILFRRFPSFKRSLETSRMRPQIGPHADCDLPQPNHRSPLLAWTRSGDVIELVFDSGSWMLVRSDVNDRQWRDVQRLLVWCKRVPSRAVL